MRQEATIQAPRYDGTAAEWFAARQQEGAVAFTDWNGRKVTLTKAGFERHTTGSHTERTQYLETIDEVLRNPSEVWINNEKSGGPYDNYTFIRYYADTVMVACCRIVNGRMNELRTWFPLYMKREVIDKCRRGLLVYTEKAAR